MNYQGFLINYDVDYYLLKFLFLIDISNLRLVSRSLNELVIATKIFQQMISLAGIPGLADTEYIKANDKIMKKCYEKGFLKILKSYHRNNKNIIINDGLNLASYNGHVAVLDWFKNSGLELNIQMML